MVDVPIEEGIETARLYLNSELHVVGFHHSDNRPAPDVKCGTKLIPS